MNKPLLFLGIDGRRGSNVSVEAIKGSRAELYSMSPTIDTVFPASIIGQATINPDKALFRGLT